MLRQNESTSLRPYDVWIEKIKVKGKTIEVLFVFIEKSKNDQTREGHTIVIGRDRKVWKCVISLFKLYNHMVSLLQEKDRTGFFFSTRGKQHQLSSKHVNSALKEACIRAGIPAQLYSSHCLRGAGATAAAEAGIETHLIVRHGNWRSTAIYRYFNEGLEARLRVSQAL